MTTLPPIDLHAHLDAGIAASNLTELAALVFAATRSLEEAEQALARADAWTIWASGVTRGALVRRRHSTRTGSPT